MFTFKSLHLIEYLESKKTDKEDIIPYIHDISARTTSNFPILLQFMRVTWIVFRITTFT